MLMVGLLVAKDVAVFGVLFCPTTHLPGL